MARLGVHPHPDGGWDFAVASDRASAVTLELYAEGGFARPIHRQPLAPERAELMPTGAGPRSEGRVWRCRVPEEPMARARWYAYRVEGPAGRPGVAGAADPSGQPSSPSRFDPAKPLLDPYAREIVFPPGFSRQAARLRGEETAGRAPLGALPGRERTRRREPPPRPGHAPEELVVYELHVDAFTRRDLAVRPERRGTYLGLIDKIPYLADLGVTAVELMPVFQWDPQENNYWGYMPMGFLAADRRYAAGGDPAGELAEAVAELHRAGIEVWLDVVYNHTAEGDETGPTYSFRGLDDSGYYLHDPADPRRYRNDSGTGNVLACARPAPRRLVLDSLRYWAEEIGVAGFRFDLATLLARDAAGRPDTDPPLLRDVERLAREGGLRLVAEPWDLGFYALGATFPGRGWWQWNGRFRDAMRSFVRGDGGLDREAMTRLAGSPDLFPGSAGPHAAAGLPVNYVACHDGFCLYDLLSYDRRRNHANGHGNRDGPADDRSWNHGWEGDVGVPAEVVALRVRQAKNLLGLVLLAAGVPMLLAGDEFLDTRFGNSNPYNQDNETSWLHWGRRERFAEVHRFTRRMIAFRRARPWLAHAPWGARAAGYLPDGPPAAGSDPRAFACHLRAGAGTGPAGEELFLAASAASDGRLFDLPAGGGWRRAVDTALPPPHDAAEPGREEPLAEPVLRLEPRSFAVLVRHGH